MWVKWERPAGFLHFAAQHAETCQGMQGRRRRGRCDEEREKCQRRYSKTYERYSISYTRRRRVMWFIQVKHRKCECQHKSANPGSRVVIWLDTRLLLKVQINTANTNFLLRLWGRESSPSNLSLSEPRSGRSAKKDNKFCKFTKGGRPVCEARCRRLADWSCSSLEGRWCEDVTRCHLKKLAHK